MKSLKNFHYIKDVPSATVIFAARTDVRVHARESVLVFSSEKPIYLQEINAGLPNDIGMVSWAEVSDDFNPRHNVIWKEYRYFLPYPPLKVEYDFELMKKALSQFAGDHDFYAFTKIDPRRPNKATRMDFFEARMEKNTAGITFIFRNKYFLWQQIRRMVSFVLKIGLGEKTVEDLVKVLDSPSQEIDKTQKVGPLPSDGLILWKFKFPPEIKFTIEQKSLLRNQRMLSPSYRRLMQQTMAVKKILEEKP